MASAKEELLTMGKMAAELGVPPAKVKKAIADLKIAPAAKKGACSYYARDAVPRVKKALG